MAVGRSESISSWRHILRMWWKEWCMVKGERDKGDLNMQLNDDLQETEQTSGKASIIYFNI